MRTQRVVVVAAVLLVLGLAGSTTAGWVTSGNNMYSDVSGNVGIGTTNPTAKLEVKGNIALTDWGDWIGASPTLARLQMDSTKWTFYTGQNVAAMRIDSNGNVGIWTMSPAERLDVAGNVKISGSGNGIVFADGTKQTTAGGAGLTLPYSGNSSVTTDAVFSISNSWLTNTVRSSLSSISAAASTTVPVGPLARSNVGKLGGPDFGVYGKADEGYAGRFDGSVKWGTSEERGELVSGPGGGASIELGGRGTPYIDFSNDMTSDYDFRIIERGDDCLSIGPGDGSLFLYSDSSVDIHGVVGIYSKVTGALVIAMGEGLDYAEGFDTSADEDVAPGTVLVIDPQGPGKLTVSETAYDTKVAGIVAGAKGLGSGVRLGSNDLDANVALAGRVYCNVDATRSGVKPGDLLTTSSTPGYAMKAADYTRAQGAILGKAMEKLEKGQKGQILVLVTLQ
jgi:hypothetical protein